MIRSTTDEMLAARHDPEPYVYESDEEGVQRLNAEEAINNGLGYFAPRVECIPSRDPYPWAREDIYGNVTADRASIRRPDLHGAKDAWHPRPEYARPEPNPILVAFRDDPHLTTPERARDYLLYLVQHREHVKRAYNPAQIEDARKVLTRLVGVFG